MRAAVLAAPRQIHLVDTWPEPVCGAGDVIVAVTAVATCGTDLAYVHGSRDIVEGGLVVGHEAIGVVVAVGADVDASRIGGRVAIEPNYPCTTCRPCLNALPSLCTSRRSPVVTEQGFLAERVAVPADFAWPLPEEVSDEDAVCIEPLAVALSAVRRAGDFSARERIAIAGAGSIGRILVDALHRRGITPAIFDLSGERVQAAVALGARPVEPGERFDLMFETTGSGAGAAAALELVDPDGLFMAIGVGETPIPVDTKVLVRRGLTITGSMIYDHPHDYAAVIDTVARGEARPGAVLHAPFSFEDAQEALVGAAGRVGKTWIRVSSGDWDA
ncbi:zinc-binding dehydrogenase [Salinibacterium sp. ZJ70]|uniref:zinc-dependent alcohol dehydrogenase n=1 Tax=Salinibacterium sp. ZJ70 TaxID=2708084 RepID=UPI0014235E22|nr:alcohol dehydrogenase catalytic domain-containing protein [Salinibacterium sp. ZJ70]